MTIGQMILDSRAHGKHTFDPETMKFWGARVLTAPNLYGLYLEEIDNYSREKKIFCVRAYNKTNGVVITFNDISTEQFETIHEAEKCMESIGEQVRAYSRDHGKFDRFEYKGLGYTVFFQDGRDMPIIV